MEESNRVEETSSPSKEDAVPPSKRAKMDRKTVGWAEDVDYREFERVPGERSKSLNIRFHFPSIIAIIQNVVLSLDRNDPFGFSLMSINVKIKLFP